MSLLLSVYSTWVELWAEEPTWGVAQYLLHLPDSTLKDPRKLRVLVNGKDTLFGVSGRWLYRYPSGYIRNLRVYLPASLEAGETLRYELKLGKNPRVSPWPGFKRTRDGFEVQTGARVFRVRHVRLGKLPKGVWNYLAVETEVDGETHVFVPLVAPRHGDTLFSYGEPKVEVDETPACLVLRLFYERGAAYSPGSKPSPTPWLSAYVELTFPRGDSAFKVFVRRTVSETRPLPSGHVLGFLGVRGKRPQVAARRDNPYGPEDPFQGFDPAKWGDEALPEEVYDYFSADSVPYARLSSANARRFWDAYAVKGEKAVSLVGANSNKFQANWQVGHALLALGADTGWAWVLDTPVIDLGSHAYEPWAHATVGLGWRWKPNAQALLAAAKRLIAEPQIFYPPRDTAAEALVPESAWPSWPVFRAGSKLLLENPGPDSALVVSYFGLVYPEDAPDALVVLDGSDTVGGSLYRSGDTLWLLVSRKLGPGERRVLKILPGRGTPAFEPESLAADTDLGLVPELKLGVWELGHIRRAYDTIRVVNGLFVRAETPAGWVAFVPLVRPYGSVFHPQDAFSHLDEEHRIIHYGEPSEVKVYTSPGGAVVRLVYPGGKEIVGADEEHLRVRRQHYLTARAELIIPKGGELVIARVHRYLRRGLYNHNGFPLSVSLYETHEAKRKEDTTLAAWTYRIDTLNNRRVVLGLKGLPILDNTGVSKTLEARPDGYYLWRAANWRGNSPFYLLGKYKEFEGWYAFDGGRKYPNMGSLALIPGWSELASRETYFDDFGYVCGSAQLYVGDAGAVGIADVAQTGWGMGWLPAWVRPGNYDDEAVFFRWVRFEPESLRRRAKAQLSVRFKVLK